MPRQYGVVSSSMDLFEHSAYHTSGISHGSWPSNSTSNAQPNSRYNEDRHGNGYQHQQQVAQSSRRVRLMKDEISPPTSIIFGFHNAESRQDQRRQFRSRSLRSRAPVPEKERTTPRVLTPTKDRTSNSWLSMSIKDRGIRSETPPSGRPSSLKIHAPATAKTTIRLLTPTKDRDSKSSNQRSTGVARRLIDIQQNPDEMDGQVNYNIYAVVPTKKNFTASEDRSPEVDRIQFREEDDDDDGGDDEDDDGDGGDGGDDDGDLVPDGWKRESDGHGAYYWHVKSGSIKRDRPQSQYVEKEDEPLFPERDASQKSSSETSTVMSMHYATFDAENSVGGHPIQFVVRQLGSLPLSSHNLAGNRSGRSLNRCIAKLSRKADSSQKHSRRQNNDEVCLLLDDDHLDLVDFQKHVSTFSISVRDIRMWGTGQEEDSKEFAFIADDQTTGRHMCHVFRCKVPAQEVATALKNNCLELLKDTHQTNGTTEGSVEVIDRRQDTPRDHHGNAVHSNGVGHRDSKKLRDIKRAEGHQGHVKIENLKDKSKKHRNSFAEVPSFLVPMSEAKKVVHCHYLGMVKVDQPRGTAVLHRAIEHSRVLPAKWLFVAVEISPSVVMVSKDRSPSDIICECRIRFLTFFGIALNNRRLGAFIMHTAANEFFAHVFHCEPNAGELCRTLEAACKLRYQKCLDKLHIDRKDSEYNNDSRLSTGFGSGVKYHTNERRAKLKA